MKVLVEHGADIYNHNKVFVNFLHLAVMRNHIQIVKMLVQSEFPLDLETEDGMTALHLAALLSHTEIAELIINTLMEGTYKQNYVKKSISKLNSLTNMSPLSLSILIQNKEIASKLITSNAKCYYADSFIQRDLSPIFLACDNENTDLLELMCDHEAQLNVKNSLGQTPLMFASQQRKQ